MHIVNIITLIVCMFLISSLSPCAYLRCMYFLPHCLFVCVYISAMCISVYTKMLYKKIFLLCIKTQSEPNNLMNNTLKLILMC